MIGQTPGVGSALVRGDLTSLAVVPEPTSLALGALGAAMLGRRRRARARS